MTANLLKKASLTFLLLFFTTAISEAQQAATDFWSNVRYGGNLGLNFSTGYTAVQVAPQALYQVNPFVGVGVGLNGSYINRNFDRRNNFVNINQDFSSTILGGSVIGLFQPIREIQLSTEFEYLNINQDFDDPSIGDRKYWVPAFFVGAGYVTGPVTIGARYDLLFNEGRSLYRNGIQPFVRVFF